MGLLDEKRKLELEVEIIESKLNFRIQDGDLKNIAAYVCDEDGSLHVYNEKINGKEESKALCQWYLSVCEEL